VSCNFYFLFATILKPKIVQRYLPLWLTTTPIIEAISTMPILIAAMLL